MTQEAAQGEGALIEAKEIGKSFGRVEALKSVSLAVTGGEVLALLGDNGAGKSSLIKILTGLFRPDKGDLLWEGEKVRFRSPREAFDLGIATVYQDLGIVDLMSIYRNFFLGREDLVSSGVGPFRRIDSAKAKREAIEGLADMGINIRSADESVANLSGGERQSIAIARGVRFGAKLLILDEPTSALSLKQSAQVLKSVEKARDDGLAVIFISHNVHHVHPVADRFVILSHGESIADFRRGDKSKEEISELIMYGRQSPEELLAGERDRTGDEHDG
ncbi:MAG: ATP-binding cassette domain-containing protein [Actinomycetota bacterium]|nr:ATP-binding cassette domain-containing protein [Actinomycetota bacterium]